LDPVTARLVARTMGAVALRRFENSIRGFRLASNSMKSTALKDRERWEHCSHMTCVINNGLGEPPNENE